MSVIDTATNTVVGSPMKLGVFATGVVVTPDEIPRLRRGVHRRTNWGRQNVGDRHGYQHGGGFPDEAWGLPDGVVVTPDGSRVYVSDRTFEGVWVIAIQPPKAPTRVKAVAGNFAATVSWVRPPSTYKVIDYKVLAYNAAGRSSASPALSRRRRCRARSRG